MPVATLAKSAIRRNESITVGYATVPAIHVNGRLAWGLMEGEHTFERPVAESYARRIDREIQKIMKTPDQLLRR